MIDELFTEKAALRKKRRFLIALIRRFRGFFGSAALFARIARFQDFFGSVARCAEKLCFFGKRAQICAALPPFFGSAVRCAEKLCFSGKPLSLQSGSAAYLHLINL